jgi:transposase InsO family protein
MDMNYYAKHNGGTSFVLLAIDIFSRYAWAVPLQTKQATTVKKGFDELLDKAIGRKPQRVRTDPGGEFANRMMKKWFDNHDILHTVTHNEMKANYVERLIKTIKSRIVKYFHHNNTFQYVKHLDDFMEGYNNTYHSSIKMKPSSVNKSNELMLWQQQYVEPYVKEINNTKVNDVKKQKTKKKDKKTFRFKTGDKVCISHLMSLFQREYDQKWTGGLYSH